MLSLNKIFKQSFIDGFAGSTVDALSMFGAMFCCLIFALYIFLIYRVVTKRSFYSHNFAVSLAGVTLITAAIIVTIQSSIVISLGMVGALSIVRFRTAIKDPMDLMFLFWAISNGIICGAGLAEFALILAGVLTILILILQSIPGVKPSMVLVVNASDPGVEKLILKSLSEHSAHPVVKARVITKTECSFTIDIRFNGDADLVKVISEMNGVKSVSLVSNDGGISY